MTENNEKNPYKNLLNDLFPEIDFAKRTPSRLDDLKGELPQKTEEGWQTGIVRMKSLGMEVQIHPDAMYKDTGIDYSLGLSEKRTPKGTFETVDTFGKCTGVYNDLGVQVWIGIQAGLGKYQKEFTRGHEEAHAMNLLGNMFKLYEESKSLKLSFSFLTPVKAFQNDMSAQKIISGRGKYRDREIVLRRNLVLEESIANVGGLIGLLKSGADYNLISSVNEGIKRGERYPFPNKNQYIFLVSDKSSHKRD